MQMSSLYENSCRARLKVSTANRKATVKAVKRFALRWENIGASVKYERGKLRQLPQLLYTSGGVKRELSRKVNLFTY